MWHVEHLLIRDTSDTAHLVITLSTIAQDDRIALSILIVRDIDQRVRDKTYGIERRRRLTDKAITGDTYR